MLGRFNDVKPMPLLSADECHKALTKKGHQQFKDLAQVEQPIRRPLCVTLCAIFLQLECIHTPDVNHRLCVCCQMFRTMDGKGKGVIRKPDLRELLYKFMLPISKEEFSKLWAM